MVCELKNDVVLLVIYNYDRFLGDILWLVISIGEMKGIIIMCELIIMKVSMKVCRWCGLVSNCYRLERILFSVWWCLFVRCLVSGGMVCCVFS